MKGESKRSWELATWCAKCGGCKCPTSRPALCQTLQGVKGQVGKPVQGGAFSSITGILGPSSSRSGRPSVGFCIRDAWQETYLMDTQHYLRQLKRLAKDFRKPLCLAIAAMLALAAMAMGLGYSVSFSITPFNGVQFSAQSPIAATAQARPPACSAATPPVQQAPAVPQTPQPPGPQTPTAPRHPGGPGTAQTAMGTPPAQCAPAP